MGRREKIRIRIPGALEAMEASQGTAYWQSLPLAATTVLFSQHRCLASTLNAIMPRKYSDGHHQRLVIALHEEFHNYVCWGSPSQWCSALRMWRGVHVFRLLCRSLPTIWRLDECLLHFFHVLHKQCECSVVRLRAPACARGEYRSGVRFSVSYWDFRGRRFLDTNERVRGGQ